MAVEYHLDVYPADDPRDGTRVVRLSADNALQSADIRDVIGVGAGQFSLRATRSEADDISPDGEQYVRVVRDDGSTELVVDGFWTNEIRYEAAVRNETQRLTVGGAGRMAYLARSVMAPHSYIEGESSLGSFIPQDPFDRTWRLWNQGTAAGGDKLGAVLWRVITEAGRFRTGATYTHKHADGLVYTDAHDDDRLRSAIPDLTLGFDQFEDSDGNDWTMPSGNFQASVGENVLQVVRRLMESGLYVEMDPDTFELRAWEGTDHRRTRTGGAWGTNVVRLQAPTDGTIATGNIKSDSERLITSHIRRTSIWAGGQDDVYGFADTPSGRPWEGYVPSDVADTTALDNLADTQLTARDEAGDVLSARLKLGQTPTQGTYLPWEHVKLDDLVTVHTGTAEWDYNEAEYPVAALRIHLRPGGDWDAWVDLGASLEAMAQRQFEIAAAAAHTHPPNPALCRPGTLGETIVSRWYYSQSTSTLNSTPPAARAVWDQTGGADIKQLKATPDGTYGATGGPNSSAGDTDGGSPVDVRLGRWALLLDATSAAQIAAGGAVLRSYLRARSRSGIGITESIQDNISQAEVYVTQGASATVRGVALAAHNLGSSAGSSKWPASTTTQNRVVPAAAADDVLSAVAGTVAGDYLVVDVGYRSFTDGITGGRIYLTNDAISDLPQEEGTTSVQNAWLELVVAGAGEVAGDLPLDTVHQDEEAVGTSTRAARCDHQHAHGLLSADGTDYHDFNPVALSDDTPLMEDASGDPGTAEEASRADHVHPEDGGGGGGTVSFVTIAKWSND